MATNPINKISANDAITRMIKAIHSDDFDSFYDVIDQYADGLGDSSAVKKIIKQYVRRRPRQMQMLSSLPAQVKELLHTDTSVQEQSPVFLNDELEHSIKPLLVEFKHAELFRKHNLQPRTKILLHGPTGNGKTTIARHIAERAELPFIQLNTEAIVESHIGSTGKNIQRALSQIIQPCILFWDEFDSVAEARGNGSSSSAAMENNRMVNSLLVNLEKLNAEVIFVAATNRLSAIDMAILRRFDKQMEVPPPTGEEKLRFSMQLSAYYNIPYIDGSQDCVSYAEIKNKAMQAAREYILHQL